MKVFMLVFEVLILRSNVMIQDKNPHYQGGSSSVGNIAKIANVVRFHSQLSSV